MCVVFVIIYIFFIILLKERICITHLQDYITEKKNTISFMLTSCNNVAPVTNLCLGRATTRSHSSQWSKKKVAVET